MKNGKPRNQGAYLLARVGLTDAEIAARVELDRAQVTKYRLSQLKPRSGNRVALRREFAVPEEAWDQPYAPPASAEAVTNGPPIGAEDLQRLVSDLLRSVETGATPYERAKVMRSATATLSLLGKLTGATVNFSEEKILRTPAWQRLKGRVLDALRPWPEAMRAVGRSLDELEDHGDADEV